MFACVTWLCKYVLSYTLCMLYMVRMLHDVYLCMLCLYMISCMCVIFMHYLVGHYTVNLVCKETKN